MKSWFPRAEENAELWLNIPQFVQYIEIHLYQVAL